MDSTNKAKMWIARQTVSLDYDASDGFTTDNPAWIYNDAALKYGIQSCYGLDTRAWNGIVE